MKLSNFLKVNVVTKSELEHMSCRTYKRPNSLNVVIILNNQGLMSVVLHAAFAAFHKVARNVAMYWFPQNAFSPIPGPFETSSLALSTSWESNFPVLPNVNQYSAWRHHLLAGCCQLSCQLKQARWL